MGGTGWYEQKGKTVDAHEVVGPHLCFVSQDTLLVDRSANITEAHPTRDEMYQKTAVGPYGGLVLSRILENFVCRGRGGEVRAQAPPQQSGFYFHIIQHALSCALHVRGRRTRGEGAPALLQDL